MRRRGPRPWAGRRRPHEPERCRERRFLFAVVDFRYGNGIVQALQPSHQLSVGGPGGFRSNHIIGVSA